MIINFCDLIFNIIAYFKGLLRLQKFYKLILQMAHIEDFYDLIFKDPLLITNFAYFTCVFYVWNTRDISKFNMLAVMAGCQCWN